MLKGTFGAIVDFMNTFDLGQVRVLVYRDEAEDVWYASALELNLTIDGTDKNAVFLELNHAIAEYHRSAEEIGDVALLNQTPDPELVALWDACIQNTPIVSPYTSYFAGRESLQYA